MAQDNTYQLVATIRLAKESDLNMLCDLYYEFQEFHTPVPTHLSPTIREPNFKRQDRIKSENYRNHPRK
jgi:hypothetical protein